MARPIEDRLTRLNTRRRGTDRLGRLSLDAMVDVIAKSAVAEGYQSRAGSQPYTRYTLGAMQEVGADYTRISIETAERVGNQLYRQLSSDGIGVEFRLQGSVPLNVHIRGVSDVDLLTIETSLVTYSVSGVLAQRGVYSDTTRTSAQTLANLRAACEKVLKSQYPAADVDTSGGKAINISGGSLARPVDVVPSHWFDTAQYQSSGQEHDRAVKILDKKTASCIENWPFLHIKLIGDRDGILNGGLRKAIRLCKNVKADAENEGKAVSLPSFDIAATMYHADQQGLRTGYIYELGILAETQRHLDFLTLHEEYAKTLMTPDGSRPIFNTTEKLAGLRQLSIELDDLAREVAKEQNKLLTGDPPLSTSRDVLNQTFLAG